MEKEFWSLVRLLHVPSLSKPACHLGRRRHSFSYLLRQLSGRFHIGDSAIEVAALHLTAPLFCLNL
jgi:hypothetical protein